jgi:hypothetical protein
MDGEIMVRDGRGRLANPLHRKTLTGTPKVAIRLPLGIKKL